jgi:hypothetical protein
MRDTTVTAAAIFVCLVFLALELFALYAGIQCQGAKSVTMRMFTYTCHY